MRREEALEAFNSEVIKFEGTRNLQWKFNLSVWTLLILAIHYKGALNINNILLVSAPIWILVMHVWFNYKIQKSQECSKKLRRIIQELLDKGVCKEANIIFPLKIDMSWKELSEKSFFFSWMILQAAITIVLALVFIFHSPKVIQTN